MCVGRRVCLYVCLNRLAWTSVVVSFMQHTLTIHSIISCCHGGCVLHCTGVVVETGTSIGELNIPHVSFSVSPSLAPLLAGMAPHIIMSFKDHDHTIHKDIYKLLCYYAETNNISAVDKGIPKRGKILPYLVHIC
jgi:hypothetical protein